MKNLFVITFLAVSSLVAGCSPDAKGLFDPITTDEDPSIPRNLGTESACCTCGEWGFSGSGGNAGASPSAFPGCGYPCCSLKNYVNE